MLYGATTGRRGIMYFTIEIARHSSSIVLVSHEHMCELLRCTAAQGGAGRPTASVICLVT